MILKRAGWAVAALVVAAAIAGGAVAAEPIDQLKPIDDAALDSVQGPAGVAKKGAPLPDAEGNLSQAKTSFDGMDAVASANSNNTLGVGIISLNNAVEGSAISLSNSLADSVGSGLAGGAGQ